MKTRSTRNAALALLGLLALALYILACTSFSPDDSKVLYPSFDGPHGTVGIAVYDRESKRSELLFVPVTHEGGQTNVPAPRLLRAQWLAGGQRVLAAWPGGKENDEDILNLAMIPFGPRSATRLFSLHDLKEAASMLVTPLCLVGERLFLAGSDKDILRLDLKTGAVTNHPVTGEPSEFSLYPAAGDQGVFYLEERNQPERVRVFGRLNPDSFARAPLARFTNDLAEGSCFAYDESGKRIAFVEKAEPTQRLVVLENDKPVFTRALGSKGSKLSFGNAVFLGRGGPLLATFQQQTEGTNGVSFGVMEIPLSSAPVRTTTLIPSVESDDELVALYFQASVSHDGKTAAVASTYVACATKAFKPEDCALFLVDLSDPQRKVTKVPIPLPADRSHPAVK